MLKREVERCWSRTEDSKDCGGPQFLVIFVMHCSLHFKYLDLFKCIEHLWGEDRDTDWLDLLPKVTKDRGDVLGMVCVTAEGLCKIVLQVWGRRLYYSGVPASIRATAQFKNSHFLIYYNTDLTNHWYLRFKEMFCLFSYFLSTFFFFFHPLPALILPELCLAWLCTHKKLYFHFCLSSLLWEITGARFVTPRGGCIHRVRQGVACLS